MDTSLMEYLAEDALKHLRKARTLPPREAERHMNEASELTGLTLKLMTRTPRTTSSDQLRLPLSDV